MVSAVSQKDEFHGRLKRIKQGGPNTLGQVYVGPAEDAYVTADTKPHFGLFATLVALIVGIISYVAGSLGQFHILSVDGVYAVERLGESGAMVAATFGDIIFATLIAFILLWVCRLRGFGPILVAAIGIFVMMGAQVFAIQSMPDVYSAMYSPSYVSQYIGQASPIAEF